VCHFGLDTLDTGGGGVFSGLGVIVEEVGRSEYLVNGGIEVNLGSRAAYSISSGRDMIADA
jgi:hypothetical protein